MIAGGFDRRRRCGRLGPIGLTLRLARHRSCGPVDRRQQPAVPPTRMELKRLKSRDRVLCSIGGRRRAGRCTLSGRRLVRRCGDRSGRLRRWVAQRPTTPAAAARAIGRLGCPRIGPGTVLRCLVRRRRAGGRRVFVRRQSLRGRVAGLIETGRTRWPAPPAPTRASRRFAGRQGPGGRELLCRRACCRFGGHEGRRIHADPLARRIVGRVRHHGRFLGRRDRARERSTSAASSA